VSPVSLAMFVLPTAGDAAVGETLTLEGDEGHHASVVRRIEVGEELLLTDGLGTVARCRTESVAKGSLEAAVLAVERHPAEPPRLVVVQAIPKGDRGELAVEMLTEVGADVIVPWAASRSVARWKGDRAAKSLEKWRSTAREAAKQARRAWFPTVAELASTDDVVALLEKASVPVVLHEAASGPLSDVPVPGRGEIVIVVGPEGGISDEELAAFAAVGAEPLRLGSSVLRSSTAGVAAAAALLARTRWR
jgi:16S rRNA (uracil1498-N3)-methyltransferase